MHIPRPVSLVKRTVLVGIATSLLAISALMPMVHAESARDCDDNAVLRCGAYTTEEVNQKYNASPSAKTIYHHFDVSSIDVNNLGTTAKNGYVTPGGRVMIGDETVATDAVTAGRQNIAGSKEVTANGVTFYTRSTDVSLNNGKLEAYVVMKDGVFDFAIIKSCGNPVRATPKAPETPSTPAPTPAPTPPAPTPTPAPTPVPVAPAPAVCSNVGDNSVGANCNTTCVGTNVCNVATPASTAQCLRLTLASEDNRTAAATVSGTAANATITGYTIDFGDGTAPVAVSPDNSSSNSTDVVTASSSSTTSSTSAVSKHQYAKDGSYVITGYVTATYADGHTNNNITGPLCKNSVSYNTPVTPVATPPTPTPTAPVATPAVQTLPNTGLNISQTVSLAGVIGLISSISYGFFTSLRLKKI